MKLMTAYNYFRYVKKHIKRLVYISLVTYSVYESILFNLCFVVFGRWRLF